MRLAFAGLLLVEDGLLMFCVYCDYSCQCQVHVYDTEADVKHPQNLDYQQLQKEKMLTSYDFGKIAEYPADLDHDCHRVREMCRNSCQDYVVMGRRIKRQVTDNRPSTNHDILGYYLCHMSKSVTQDKDHPFRVDIQAQVDQCSGKKPIKQRHTHLCCVITPLEWAGKSFNVLAWDEYCDSSKLHV